jgi:hypothetical protein
VLERTRPRQSLKALELSGDSGLKMDVGRCEVVSLIQGAAARLDIMA